MNGRAASSLSASKFTLPKVACGGSGVLPARITWPCDGLELRLCGRRLRKKPAMGPMSRQLASRPRRGQLRGMLRGLPLPSIAT